MELPKNASGLSRQRPALRRLRIQRLMPAATVCLLVLSVVNGSVRADVVTLPDPTDRSDDSNDISRVRHRHHRSDHRLLRHVVWFDGQQAEPTDVQLVLRHWDGNSVQRLHVVVRRERGALATEVLDEEEQGVGGGRAWMNADGSRLVMQFRRGVFDGATRYRWKAESLLGIGEFDQPCDDEDTGPPVCLDLAPRRGWIEHRFQ